MTKHCNDSDNANGSFVPRETHFRSPFEASRSHLQADPFFHFLSTPLPRCFSFKSRARAFSRVEDTQPDIVSSHVPVSDSFHGLTERNISRDNRLQRDYAWKCHFEGTSTVFRSRNTYKPGGIRCSYDLLLRLQSDIEIDTSRGCRFSNRHFPQENHL